jgi:hypothetical protein
VPWFELPLASSSSLSLSGLLQQPRCPKVVQGASLAEVQGKAASQTPPPAEARGKSPAAPGPVPAPGVGAPAPRAGDDAVSSGDGLTWHRATQWTLRQARKQKGDHRHTCNAPKTSHLQKTS